MAAAPPPEVARAALYHLLGGLLVECASEPSLRDIHAKELLPTLGAGALATEIAEALCRMHAELASEARIERIRADHAALFLGAGKSKAPPWESVYRSPERLVWQAPAYAVLEHYARAGFGYDNATAVPPDHIGRELLFVATLDVEATSSEDPERARALVAARRAFLRDHVLVWAPAFLDDVRAHASTEFYRALADALRALLSFERADVGEATSASRAMG